MVLYISLMYVTVISTCPLHPLPGWYDVVAELRLGLVLPFTDICVLATYSCDLLDSTILVARYRIGRLSEMLSGFSIFCYQCLTLLEWHFVLSTCPLHPLPGWYDVVAELRLIRTQTGVSTCPLHPLPGWYDVVAELRLISTQTGATLY